MPIDLNGACASMMLGAKGEPELDWLTFTAVQPNSSVQLNKSKDDPSLNAKLEVRVNDGRWTEYKWTGVTGTEIELPSIGDRCQWRAVNSNARLSIDFYSYYQFKMLKAIEVTGDARTLLSKNELVKVIPDFSFESLCRTAIVGNPIVQADEFKASSCRNMFRQSLISSVHIIGNKVNTNTFYLICYSCTVQKALIEISEISPLSFQYAFYNCSKLNDITVKFKDWSSDGTIDWVKNVSPTGDFYCPADLPLIWDDSHIPIGWTAHPEGKEPVPYPDPLEDKYLRFTSEQNGSLLRLDKSEDVPELNARLEYKINAGNWEEYTWGEDEGVTDKKLGHLISLPKVGDCVKWRAVDRNETFSVSFGNHYVFSMDKPIACAGNVMSLLDKTCELLTVPEYGFNNLFKKAKITSYPLLPALQMVGVGGYYDLFYNVNTLKDKSIVISIKSFEANSYGIGYTFYGNTQLNNITVNFPMWPFSAGNSNWVNGVSPHGTFTCPSDLPVIFGVSNIPHGWTVDNGLTEPSEEEILNACYQYTNGQLIIQPDFKACLNRAEQIDFVKHGKTYWHKNTPLPNPHRTDIGSYYKMTDISNAFNGFSAMAIIDLSEWDCSEVVNTDNAFQGCTSVTTAYARTQADCDKLNASSGKPTTWEFVIHPDLLNVPSFTLGNAGEFSGQYKPTGNLTKEGLPIYASENVWNFQMKPTVEEDGRTRFVFFSTQGIGNSYACNTPLDTPIDPTACCGKRQLLRDLTYTGGDGQQYAVTIMFP